ncbi:uncharacterized protein LOC126621151 isoform X2 [Malus sylvestris]|uniref:uncharacterized protein LOC126621151 isoform X2 n=1 Tax=Malus sylvestris TaxID=3752 RepID=UPI0021AD4F54|nr:uncharacterized protein LOC126621151 isoform X2 [Malus sylvestris]
MYLSYSSILYFKVSKYDMDWSCPTAIVVGNENRGISDEALALSDLHCSNPMKGMVDSFSMFQLLQAFSCTMQFVIEHLAGCWILSTMGQDYSNIHVKVCIRH